LNWQRKSPLLTKSLLPLMWGSSLLQLRARRRPVRARQTVTRRIAAAKAAQPWQQRRVE
jgi:hypothetical protein